MVPTMLEAIVVLATLARSVAAHVALWHPSVYGFNASNCSSPDGYYNQPVLTDLIVQPLRQKDGLNFEEWWFHGCARAKPNTVMQITAGQTLTLQHSCNKEGTIYTNFPEGLAAYKDVPCWLNPTYDATFGKDVSTYGDPSIGWSNGPLHAGNISDAAGCALAITYKNADAVDTRNADYTVFSTNRTCVWFRETDYQIPADMPPCPGGKCICTWSWYHDNLSAEGYWQEMYQVGFDCNIVGGNPTKQLATSVPPKLCSNDSSACVQGAKQPMVWQAVVTSDYNIPWDGYWARPPLYNEDWGFSNGAQNDIFVPSTATAVTSLSIASTSSSTTSASRVISSAPSFLTPTRIPAIVQVTLTAPQSNLVLLTAATSTASRSKGPNIVVFTPSVTPDATKSLVQRRPMFTPRRPIAS